MPTQASADVVVVGGGLAGLTAALLLGRGGLRVSLVEKADALGGRARTLGHAGYRFNLGAHAVYRRGATVRVLGQLGVPIDGAPVPPRGYAVRAGVAHTLPVGPVSLLTTGLLPLAGKVQVARLMTSLERADVAALHDVPLAEWLDSRRLCPAARDFAEAAVRLATYADAPARLSAGLAVQRLRGGSAGVLYLHGGWQGLVDGLRQRARGAGVSLRTRARAVAVDLDGARVTGVRLASGTRIEAPAAIVAADPRTAAALVEGEAHAALAAWAATREPVRVACLDLALRRLPRPGATFALGTDRPLYYSVHSAVARLAPESGGALVHLARYGGGEPGEAERELDGLMDLMQPGWRDEVVCRRFVPDLIVAHGLPAASEGGLTRRPGPEVAGTRGLYVAGDWVGPRGLLADASVASAEQAAAAVLTGGARAAA